jgi:indole-3-glycerol phosphate synthase
MILDEIIRYKKWQVANEKEVRPLKVLLDCVEQMGPTRGFGQALAGEDGAVKIIAEVKKASPSKGVLRADFDPVDIAKTYEECGACAVSVLTDRRFFMGSFRYLEEIRRAVSLPLLCKDFVVDPYQVLKARVSGADAVLLIAAVLEGAYLKELLDVAREFSLDALVEVHEMGELLGALDAGAHVVGINNRNLKTFKTDLRVTMDLVEHIPEGRVIVSESGINSREDIERLKKRGVHAFLVGEALMKAERVGSKLRELTA